MKLKSIVALLGLSASIGALAGPLTPNTPTPSVINPPPGVEGSLQSIVDSVFGPPGHINVNTDQSSAGMFSSSSPNFATSVPTLVAEFTANAANQTFGIWFGTDTTNVVGFDILRGGAVAHDFVSIAHQQWLASSRQRWALRRAIQLRHFRGRADQSEFVRILLQAERRCAHVLLARRAERAGRAHGSRRCLPGRRDDQLAVRLRGRRCLEGRFRLQRHGGQGRIDQRRAGAGNLCADACRPGRHGLRRASSQIPLRALGARSRRRPDHERTSVRSFFSRLKLAPEIAGATRAGDRARRPR